MALIVPSWFKQRQGKAEAAGSEQTYRLTAPNLGEAFVSIQQSEKDGWCASLRRSLEGPEEAVTEGPFATPGEAWEAAFELYRIHVVV
jgi:hypothetical protein